MIILHTKGSFQRLGGRPYDGQAGASPAAAPEAPGRRGVRLWHHAGIFVVVIAAGDGFDAAAWAADTVWPLGVVVIGAKLRKDTRVELII